jgi:excinuclease ABC subunit C
MREVLYRRYFKVLMGEEKAPDLIVLDGGHNQISVCNEILDSLNLDIPVIGLVKNDKHRTNQIMNKNYELLDVKKDTNLFIYLTRIQDEVHRFAISYHRNIKSKGALSSRLDLIPGIGEVRRKELLKKFGSLKKMKEASLEELCEVVPEDVAKKIIDSLE